MRKRIFAAIFMLVVFLSCVTVGVNAASVYDRQKKSIYFVMDDSGSMDNGKNDHDANYSLQSLIAMCDSEDEVNLYFLNENPSKPKYYSMSSKSNAMIESVMTTYPESNGGTSYSAVGFAKKKLIDSVSKNDDTEYWLVVLTDGAFDEGFYTAVDDLKDFSRTPLSNGSNPNVLFIFIGGSGDAYKEGQFNYIPGTDIIEAMNGAASLISGRIELAPVYSDDGTSLTVNLPYPARNVIVFAQDRETAISSYSRNETAVSDNGTNEILDISERYTVQYPVEGREIDKSTVCFVKEGSGSSIGVGELTLSFEEPIDRENTVVLVEPAIGLVAHYYNQDGQEIDPSQLGIGETAMLKYSLCDSETQQVLDESILGGSVNYYSEIDGKRYNSNEVEFKVDKDTIAIGIFAELPDGFVLNIASTYEDLQYARLVSFSLSNGGNFEADYADLASAEGINANVTVGGFDVANIDEFELDINGYNIFTSSFDVEKDKTYGRFVIKPKAGLIAPLTPYQKEYEVVLTDKISGKTYTETLNVDIPGERNWWEIIKFILIVALIVYVILVLFTKKWFRFGATFTVWDGSLPQKDDRVPYERRTIWKLYWHEFVQLITFSGADGLWHFLQFFLPFTCQKVTLYRIAGGNFSSVTLYASRGGELKVKDHNMTEVRNKIVSDYGIIKNNRRTPVNFDSVVDKKGLLPLSDGESLKARVFRESWYITYNK